MSGLRLSELDAVDLMSVLPFLLEEELHVVSEESAASRSGLRVTLYQDFYGTTYKYPYKSKNSTGRRSSSMAMGDDFGTFSEEDAAALGDVKPFNPRQQETKPFVPSTPFDPTSDNPFGGILDAPLN